jgi:hypothetical protein
VREYLEAHLESEDQGEAHVEGEEHLVRVGVRVGVRVRVKPTSRVKSTWQKERPLCTLASLDTAALT